MKIKKGIFALPVFGNTYHIDIRLPIRLYAYVGRYVFFERAYTFTDMDYIFWYSQFYIYMDCIF